MHPDTLDEFRAALRYRRMRLRPLVKALPGRVDFRELLEEVEAAQNRVEAGSYGFCEVCMERIEWARLQSNPLLRFCSSHIAPEDKQKLEQDQQLASLVRKHQSETPEGSYEVLSEPAVRPNFGTRLILALNAGWKAFSGGAENHTSPYLDGDLDRASVIQSKMLPGRWLRLDPWDIYYSYSPLAQVGGDYCDLIPAESGRLFLFFGDAVGKGVSASLIASQLHALFRTLASLASPFEEMAERANRIFCESMATGNYATVVCGHALPDGKLELVNAGHPPPLLLRDGEATRLGASGLPLGLFYSSKYDIARIQLAQGETVLFYTDGVTEARNNSGVEYGCERLARLASERHDLIPEELVRSCLSDLSTFTEGVSRSDDLTMMAIRCHVAPPRGV